MAGHYGADPYYWDGGTNAPHISRYFLARGWVMPGEVVLDAACGSGYGTKLLALGAGKAIGYDVDAGCIEGARRDLSHNVEFEVKDLDKCELPEVDVIVSIETIEHLNDMRHFTEEAKKKARRLIIVTVPIGGTSYAYKDIPPGPGTEKNDFLSDGAVDSLFVSQEWKIQAGFRFGYSYFGVYYKKNPERT